MPRTIVRPRDAALQSIRALVATLAQSARRVEQGTGVTNAQLFLLREIERAGPLSINELAALALTAQNTVSEIISRLAKSGLVARHRAKADARRVEVSLTAAGRRVLGDAPDPPTARLISALDELGERELRTVASALDRVIETLGGDRETAGMLFEPSVDRRRARRRSRG